MQQVSLKTYYNKLVQVQINLQIVLTLQGEIFHHLNNTANIFESTLRLLGKNADDAPTNDLAGQIFHRTWAEIKKDVEEKVAPIMAPIAKETERLQITSTHLLNLVQQPAIVTKENLDALSAFNDVLHDACDEFRHMRRDAEIRLVRASGFVTPDFTI